MEVLPAGTSAFRIHTAERDPVALNHAARPSRISGGRFDSDDGNYGYIYVGDSPSTAIAETLCRDLPLTGRARLVPWTQVARRALTRMTVVRDVTVLRLHGPALTQVGAPLALTKCGAQEYETTRAWAKALRRWVPQAEGFAYPGHTEYLAARAGVDEVAMLMVGPRLRVVPATIHIPLREVPRTLTPERIVSAGRLLARALHRDFGIAAPTIGVLGVNPHAGERGLLGDEEATIVAPALAALRAWAAEIDAPVTFEGPLPADTAFPQHAAGRFDGLVAMYHDQGLGPFKLLHLHDGVNMTLGLPFVRTSPDHGTARDIAGQGVADPSSIFEAVTLARGQISFAL